MECFFCKSSNIKNLKVFILKPVDAKKNKCLQCNKNFITHKIVETTNISF